MKDLGLSFFATSLFAFGCFFLVSINCLQGQDNLIPNPSFEIYEGKKKGKIDFQKIRYWSSADSTGEYPVPDLWYSPKGEPINTCYGRIKPYGKGTIGIMVLDRSVEDANFREYLSVRLILNLKRGKKYMISFDISNGIPSSDSDKECTGLGSGAYGIKGLGICFTSERPQRTSKVFAQKPQLLIEQLVYSWQWQKIELSFVADKDYEYMTIGNFGTDKEFKKFSFQDNSPYQLHKSDNNELTGKALANYCYYFIDNVRVFEARDSFSIDANLNHIAISPSPLKVDSVRIFPISQGFSRESGDTKILGFYVNLYLNRQSDSNRDFKILMKHIGSSNTIELTKKGNMVVTAGRKSAENRFDISEFVSKGEWEVSVIDVKAKDTSYFHYHVLHSINNIKKVEVSQRGFSIPNSIHPDIVRIDGLGVYICLANKVSVIEGKQRFHVTIYPENAPNMRSILGYIIVNVGDSVAVNIFPLEGINIPIGNWKIEVLHDFHRSFLEDTFVINQISQFELMSVKVIIDKERGLIKLVGLNLNYHLFHDMPIEVSIKGERLREVSTLHTGDYFYSDRESDSSRIPSHILRKGANSNFKNPFYYTVSRYGKLVHHLRYVKPEDIVITGELDQKKIRLSTSNTLIEFSHL